MKVSFASAQEVLAIAKILINKDTFQITFGSFMRYNIQCLQAIAIET